LARLRFCEPLLQEAVQVDQAPKEPSTQSMAQAKRLQSRASLGCGQETPPKVGSAIWRLRC
jgi:hypothetical protein